jgi:hypothetical protein
MARSDRHLERFLTARELIMLLGVPPRLRAVRFTVQKKKKQTKTVDVQLMLGARDSHLARLANVLIGS